MTAIAIFVKTPGRSPIKTRLAAGIGQAAAEHSHLLGAKAIAEVAVAADIGPAYWAVAETDALEDDTWSSLPTLNQGSGTLGERMAHVHTTLVQRHGSAILLGADAPQVCAEHLIRASNWLEQAGQRMVIGPAEDGGFWLFGSNQVIEMTRWQSVTYSREDTLDAFRDSLHECGEWNTLPHLTDLDTPEDLATVAAELTRLAEPLPAQQAMIEFLATLTRHRP